MNQYVSGTFYSGERANDAVDDLIALGYPPERIDVIMSPETRGRFESSGVPGAAKGAHVAEGAAAGGVIGGALGAIVAGLTATGAIIGTGGAAAPLVAGPLAAALAGLGAGAATGGLIGALVGAGIDAERAKKIQHDVEAGAVVVGVRAKDEDLPDVRLILASDDVAHEDALPATSRDARDPVR